MAKILNFNSASFEKSVFSIDNKPRMVLPEYAFIGRSNVGKSSLINSLTNIGGLAKISSKPGKTISLNYFNVLDKLYLVDLPGYGYAKISKKEQKSISKLVGKYFLTKEISMLFLLIDSRHSLKDSDIEIIEEFERLGLSICIILTKCDKKQEDRFDWSVSLSELSKKFNNIAGMLYTSSKSKDGIKQLRSFLISHYNEARK